MHPVLELSLNTLFGMLCAGAGDLAMQWSQLRFVTKKKQPPSDDDQTDFCSAWDVPRTLRYTIAPGALHGFIGASWTVFLLPAATHTGDSVTFPEVVKKSVIDVLALTFFLVPLDFVFNSLLNKKSCKQIVQKFKDDYPQACLFSVVWFPVDLLVFSCVPLHFQPATNKVLDLIYFLFLSLPINQARIREPQGAAEVEEGTSKEKENTSLSKISS
eukprot:GGOE01036518.1.p1 GENE.GGOE01036518.1~~GGOE01036518.1.p1  ORF type:complete len:215 (+),score=46.41 GGOE01036518.1:90-734(+)